MSDQPKARELCGMNMIQKDFGTRVHELCIQAIYEHGVPIAEVLGVLRWASVRLLQTNDVPSSPARVLTATQATLAQYIVDLMEKFLSSQRKAARAELVGTLLLEESQILGEFVKFMHLLEAQKNRTGILRADPETLRRLGVNGNGPSGRPLR